MSPSRGLEDLEREERIEFCRQVMERLSDLVEDRADPEFCARVEKLLADCQPFRVYRETLARTIELARECGAVAAERELVDEEILRACVERARARLRG